MTVKKLTVLAILAVVVCALFFTATAALKMQPVIRANAQETYTMADVDSALEDGPVLLEFELKGCGWCQKQHPITKQLASEYAGKVTVMFIDVDENTGLVDTFHVNSYPQMYVIAGKTGGQYVFVDENGETTKSIRSARFSGYTEKGQLETALDAAIRLRR